MTKLQRIQVSLLMTAITGAYVAVIAGIRSTENVLALSTTSCGIGMFVGSLAALRQRTWGVGLVFAAAIAFGTAAALDMGPPAFFVFALAGMLPMGLGAKPFAHFGRDAAILFAAIAIALGVGAAVAWGFVAPAVWELAYGR